MGFECHHPCELQAIWKRRVLFDVTFSGGCWTFKAINKRRRASFVERLFCRIQICTYAPVDRQYFPFTNLSCFSAGVLIKLTLQALERPFLLWLFEGSRRGCSVCQDGLQNAMERLWGEIFLHTEQGFTLGTCAKRNTNFTAFPRCQVDPTVAPDPVTGKHKMRHWLAS